MARQLRIECEGAFYHVTSRENQRGDIFFDDDDREIFLEILKRTKDRYGYLLHAYVLMGNHYHLLIETPKANLSQIMQNINTSYTVYVNRRYRRWGHLFQGRFKAIVVNKEDYLLRLSRYIHLNPVKSGMVTSPKDYRWTNYAN
jgi:REP element-mobilizing transposase RayT